MPELWRRMWRMWVFLMTDNDLIRLFLPIIQNGLIADGYLNVTVEQNYQPTMQGVPSGPTVYFFKVSDKRYGFLGRYDVWDNVHNVMTHTETQIFEATFQVSALVTQLPIVTNSYTASDLVNEVASIMQSDNTRAILLASNVEILRVIDVRNPYFIDDRDQYEAFPSFDFVLTYPQSRISTTPIISTENLVINRV